MAARLRANLAREGIGNVTIVQDRWPHARVEAHDFVFCAHAMYESPDVVAFLQKMTASARRMCFFLIRAPAPDSLMAEAAQTVWGQPHDLPSFAIAYNVLLQMGVYADVRMEEGSQWLPSTSRTVAEAVGEVKSKLGLAAADTSFDAYLENLASRRLVKRDGHFEWPGQMRSALIYWAVGSSAHPCPAESAPVESRSPYGDRSS